MKEMFTTLKEAFKENPSDFIKSIILLAVMSVMFYVAIWIGGPEN